MFVDCPKVKVIAWMFSPGFFPQGVAIIRKESLSYQGKGNKVECLHSFCQTLGVSEIPDSTG